MIKITTIEFTNSVKSLFALTNIYPNTLPDNEEVNTGVFLYSAANDKYSHTNELSFQFLTCGVNRTQTEAAANDLYKALNFTFPLQIADTLLVGNYPLQKQPIYVGVDKEKYLFSFNMIFYVQ